MFGSRFLSELLTERPPPSLMGKILIRLAALGPNPAFFQRLRSWFNQTWILEFGVAEILGPIPVVAKEAEAKIINTPAPFTLSASRAQALTTVTVSSTPAWMEMRPIQGLRRQLRRRQGWSDLRKARQLQAHEESIGLLAAA